MWFTVYTCSYVTHTPTFLQHHDYVVSVICIYLTDIMAHCRDIHIIRDIARSLIRQSSCQNAA